MEKTPAQASLTTKRMTHFSLSSKMIFVGEKRAKKVLFYQRNWSCINDDINAIYPKSYFYTCIE